MKRIILVFLLICMIVSLWGCTEERINVADYQYMYDGFLKDWNKTMVREARRDDLFGYGEYLYNSYLILFPRETPSTLQEFYFHWTELTDVYGYAIYFTCQMEEQAYYAFAEGLDGFQIHNGNESVEPLYDDTHFSLPAYILQWKDVGGKWEVLEYMMLDEQNHTAVFVYTMGELRYIEENSAYRVTPLEMSFMTENFSIYEDFENSTYDISFLDFLQ